VIALALLTACDGSEAANDPGPAPGARHQEQVRAKVDELLRKDRTLDGSATGLRFAEPVRAVIPRWHFDPQVDGRTHEFGSFQGGCVDDWFTPTGSRRNTSATPNSPSGTRWPASATASSAESLRGEGSTARRSVSTSGMRAGPTLPGARCAIRIRRRPADAAPRGGATTVDRSDRAPLCAAVSISPDDAVSHRPDRPPPRGRATPIDLL